MSAQGAVLVTGGAGFIGSAVVRRLALAGEPVVTVDALKNGTGAAPLAEVMALANHALEHVDITDAPALRTVFDRYQPRAVLHLAAESHVDRSIDGPDAFIQTNLVGTFRLLEEARRHYTRLSGAQRDAFRFVHVSTDEVFGSLADEGRFNERTPYDPRSPYSATKAGSDHLARAWAHTYGLPVIVTNCTNNYGSFQFPEKLIPHMVLRALQQKTLPVYGNGSNVRDWIFVEDHVDGLLAALEHGVAGATYLFGGDAERTNLNVVRSICDVLDRLRPMPAGSYHDLVEFVEDRPGHDQRYAVDSTVARAELGWQPRHSFEEGLEDTVRWYVEHPEWYEQAAEAGYESIRIGLAAAP